MESSDSFDSTKFDKELILEDRSLKRIVLKSLDSDFSVFYKLKTHVSFKKKKELDSKYLKKSSLFTEPEQQKVLGAVSTNNCEAVERLLSSGGNPNSTDKIGRSALHLAASKGYTEIVKILLKHKADPNKQDIIQNTPLHLAACNSNLQIIKLLIDGGADLRSLDVHGRNPLQLAESKLHILAKSWKSGAIELLQIKNQVEEIVDMMITLWRHKETTLWGHHRDNVDDLEIMKLSLLSNGTAEEVDDQMNKLLTELQQFSIK